MLKIRFLADEHIKLSAVRGLKVKGIDIISLYEANMKGFSDSDVLAFANKEGRVIVTRDKDFLRLASEGEKHKGIIFLTSPLDTGSIIREAEKISLLYKALEIENAVFYIPLK